MRESVLRDFFEGRLDANALNKDLVGTVEGSGGTFRYRIENLDEEFEVRTEHLIRLCDAVLAGELDAKNLGPLGFCLAASDAFHWDTDVGDEEVVAETIFDWSDAEINYPLTPENIAKFRERLITRNNPFIEEDVGS